VEHLDLFKGVFLPYANFFIFMALAIYFFRKPLRAMAEKRRAQFDAALKQAQEAKDLAEAKNRELTARLAKLDDEVAEIRRLTANTAQFESKKIVEEANRLAAHLKEEAQRMANAEVDRAKDELRRTIVAAVKGGVETKIQTELNIEAQMKLAKSRIGQLKSVQV